MGASETPILQRIRLAVGCLPGIRVFRNNVGTGWIGEVASHTPDRVIIVNPRPLRAGLCTGSSDLIGWRTITIGPEHLGRQVAQFLAIEAKAPGGRVSLDQTNFISQVRSAGGCSGVAYSPEQARQIINQPLYDNP
jgi:hypothetical protein